MALSLSELLERIRPAGAPGAPAEGERPRDAGATRPELAAVAAALAGFAAEVDAIEQAAAVASDDIRREADRDVERIRRQLPDRLLRAEATADATDEERVRRDRTELGAHARRDIEAIDATIDEGRRQLVADVVDKIWIGVLGGADVTNGGEP